MTWGHDDRYVAPARERPETAGAHIRLHRVYKVHHIGDTGVVALAGVDVEIPPGEFVAVVGPSGTGKSTILHLLGGLDQASAGIVEIDGPVLIVALIVIAVATTIAVVAATRALLRSSVSAVLRGDPE